MPSPLGTSDAFEDAFQNQNYNQPKFKPENQI